MALNLDIKKVEHDISKPKNFLIISIVGSFWLVVLVGAFVLWPWYKQAGEIKTQTEATNAQAKSIEADNDLVNEKKKILITNAKEIEKLNIAFPKTPMEEELMLQMKSIVSKVGNLEDLKTFSASASTSSGASSGGVTNLFSLSLPGYSTATTTYAGEGSYTDFQKLLKEIEKNLRLMTITQVSISNSEKDSGDPKLSFTLNIETFYGGGEPTATEASSATPVTPAQ